MTGVIALARFDALLFLRSQRFVPPLVAYVLVVGLLLAPTSDPVLVVYGTAAAALFPVSAWLAMLCQGCEPPTQRAIAATAVGSDGRAWAARLLAVGMIVWTTAVLTTVVPAVASVFERPPTPGELATALLAMVVTTTGGATVGVLCSAPFVPSAGWRVLAGGGLLLATIPLADAGPGRFLLPPSVAVADLLDAPTPPSVAAWLGDVLGPLALSMVLALLAGVTLARRLT